MRSLTLYLRIYYNMEQNLNYKLKIRRTEIINQSIEMKPYELLTRWQHFRLRSYKHQLKTNRSHKTKVRVGLFSLIESLILDFHFVICVW